MAGFLISHLNSSIYKVLLMLFYQLDFCFPSRALFSKLQTSYFLQIQSIIHSLNSYIKRILGKSFHGNEQGLMKLLSGLAQPYFKESNPKSVLRIYGLYLHMKSRKIPNRMDPNSNFSQISFLLVLGRQRRERRSPLR